MRKYSEMYIFLYVIIYCSSTLSAHPFNETKYTRDDYVDLISTTIPNGDLIGRIRHMPGGGSFISFEGIPYAEPPVDDNRFRDPIAAPIWTDAFHALEPGPICTQFDTTTFQVVGQEDCLYLNVFTPNLSPSELYPVLFYIHGGGLTVGSSYYADNPDFLVGDGVVVVAINYRLDVFGFLNLDNAEVPGNAGHKDQVLALRWVLENIQQLGGNPMDITVAGQSAGAFSAHYFHISEMSKNSFQKLVVLGGSPSADLLLFQDHHLENAEILGRMLGFDTTNYVQFVNDLRGLPASDIMNALFGGEAPDGSTQPNTLGQFVSSVEMEFEGREAFLTKLPYQYLDNGEFTEIPVFIEYCSKEGTSFGIDFNDAFSFVRPKWGLVENSEELEFAVRSVKEQYFGTQDIDVTDPYNILRGAELRGDIMFTIPILEVTRNLVRFSSQPTYLMRFSYRGSLNHGIVELIGMQGATHADEILYFLPREDPRVNDHSADGWVRRRLGKVLANFIKYGDPTPSPTNYLLPTKWLPVTADTMHYMAFNSDPIPSINPESNKLRFWDDLDQSIMASRK